MFAFFIFAIGCSQDTESDTEEKRTPIEAAQQACDCIEKARLDKKVNPKDAKIQCEKERKVLSDSYTEQEQQQAFTKAFHRCINKINPPIDAVEAAKWGLPNLSHDEFSPLKRSVISNIRVHGGNIFVGIKMDYYCQLEPKFDYQVRGTLIDVKTLEPQGKIPTCTSPIRTSALLANIPKGAYRIRLFHWNSEDPIDINSAVMD